MTLEHRHYGEAGARLASAFDPPLKQDQPQGQPGGENGRERRGRGTCRRRKEGMPGAPE